jgi:hypothetical protein
MDSKPNHTAASTPQTPNQPAQISKQTFQTHIVQLENNSATNTECHLSITKNISSFIAVLEPFKHKLHTLSANCAASKIPLLKIFKELFDHYYLSISYLIDNFKLTNQGLEAPLKNYQASFSKIKHLKDLQNKFITSLTKLNLAKQTYFGEFKKFKQQNMVKRKVRSGSGHFLFFWPQCMAWRILVPQIGIKPGPLQ